MKRDSLFSLIIILILTACSSGPTTIPADAVDTAIAQTLTAVPTQEPLPTNTPEPTKTPAPTFTPRPTNTPRPTATPTPPPEPITLSGTGDQVIDVEKWDGPAIARISYTGGSNFAVWNYGPDGERIDLLVNTVGQYQGTRPIDFLEDENTARFQIESSGQWEVTLLPLNEIGRAQIPGKLTGTGDDVVLLVGADPDLLVVDATEADSNFAIWAFGNRRDLVVNEIAPYDGTVVLPSGTFLLVIEATGPWSLGVTAR